MDDFSELISTKRQEKGYSMRTVSRLLRDEEGISASRTIINFIEKGARPPTFELAYGLSNILEINTAEVLEAAYKARASHNENKEKQALAELIDRKKLKYKLEDLVARK